VICMFFFFSFFMMRRGVGGNAFFCFFFFFYKAFLKLRFTKDSILVPRNLYFYVELVERVAL